MSIYANAAKIKFEMTAAKLKKECHKIALRIAEGEDLTQSDREMLYAFFLPKLKGKKYKDPFQWVASVAQISKNRGWQRFIYANGELVVATDGSILCWTQDDRSAGSYDTAGNMVEDSSLLPYDWQRLIPNETDTMMVRMDSCMIHEKGSKKYIYQHGDDKFGYDLEYFKHVANGEDFVGVLTSDRIGTSEPILTKNQHGFCLIASYRLNLNE